MTMPRPRRPRWRRSLRPQWRMFVSMLDDLGRDELNRRWAEAKRLIHDNGITHNDTSSGVSA